MSGLTKIAGTEGFASLYAGFIPILFKQVPYAIGQTLPLFTLILVDPSLGQFTVNERCTEFIYNQISPERRQKLTKTEQMGITLTSGVTAGFAAAFLSHVSWHH